MSYKDTTKFAPIEGLLQTDSYKLGHKDIYELGGNTTKVYSNWTNRTSRIKGINGVVHFGLQAFLDDLQQTWKPFFDTDEDTVVELYKERLQNFLPANFNCDHIRQLHRLGFLPLEFKAVPEGTVVPIRVPSFTIENTRPEFFWLTNYIETVISAYIWQPSTSATIAYHFRKMFDEYAIRTTGSTEGVQFQGHDFSFRGMSSVQTAQASGAGHLLSFSGTDSLPALDWIDQHYGGQYLAASVPATEHSVMCAGAATLGEDKLFEAIIDHYPTGIVSIVSDTFDLWKVLGEYLPNLKEKILKRDGKVVIRPDSGDPVDILTGNKDADTEVEVKGVIELLWDCFGGVVNEQGFKVLDPHIGAIYGDSITYDRAIEINERLIAKGFATTNWVAGIGSFTYQYNTRDTFGSAIKATWAEIDGKGYDLQKDPVTDNGTKKSAKGRLSVKRGYDGILHLYQQVSPELEATSELQPVWRDGKFIVRQTFDEVQNELRREIHKRV